MDAKHTPGPWQVNHGDQFQVCDADGKVRGCSPIATMHGSASEKRANARLIAAAPELLEVAQLILAEDLLDFLPEEYVFRVRAAIAKATGEQQ